MNWLPEKWQPTEEIEECPDQLSELWTAIVHIEMLRSGDRKRAEYFANTFCYAIRRNLISLKSIIQRALDIAQTVE